MKENGKVRGSSPKEPHLPAELLPWIGKASDAALAREFGVPRLRILKYRQRHGIPGNPCRILWTTEMDAVVRGDLPNAECAVILGLQRTDIRNRRRTLGVPVPERPANWIPETDALLGTMSDIEVARRLGLASATVSSRRRKLGIRKFLRSRKPNPDPAKSPTRQNQRQCRPPGRPSRRHHGGMRRPRDLVLGVDPRGVRGEIGEVRSQKSKVRSRRAENRGWRAVSGG